MTAEQKRQRFSKLTGEIKKGLAVLSGAQLTRLQQIYRQDSGPLAFSDADVAEALSLTADQKSGIRAVQAEYRDSRFRRSFASVKRCILRSATARERTSMCCRRYDASASCPHHIWDTSAFLELTEQS